MFGKNSRIPAAVALVGALLGLVFATYSTLDYAAHLDRQLHDVHCSVIPGAPPQEEAEGCRAAMYSAYSAILKTSLWGGIPVSSFAQGCFAFLAGFALFLLVAGPRASKTAVAFFAGISITPLLVSIGMFIIALTQLGQLCQTCVGIYLSSGLVAAGGLLGLLTLRGVADGSERERGSVLWPLAWLPALGFVTLAPSLVYAQSAPDHRPFLKTCGSLKKPSPGQGVAIPLVGARAIKPAVIFEDPLCATCKAVHQRLEDEGVMERLNAELILFPLDSKCNWMLASPLHPGACAVSKAVLCANERAPQVLAWAYDNQDQLLRAGKADLAAKREDDGTVKEVIKGKWGPELVACIDAKATNQRLNKHLQFAVDNSVPVSTPQIYLSNQRLCDEDTDMGLKFTLTQIAPEVVQ
jgi:hypothetical protein